MKKHFSVILFSLFLLPAMGLCITNYSVGDQLYVLAPSGLVLRETANPQGKKITSVALGDAVTILKDNFRKVPYSVQEFKGYNIRGFWVKVHTAGGQDGYVFDGYLSRYKAPGTFQVKEGLDTLPMVEQYIAGTSEPSGPRVNLAIGQNRYDHYKQVFKNGTVVEESSGEGGAWYKVTFNKGMSMEEVYLIGRLLWIEGKVKSQIASGVITLNTEDEMQQAEVMNKGGLIILTLSVAD